MKLTDEQIEKMILQAKHDHELYVLHAWALDGIHDPLIMVDAFAELTELRKLVANKWQSDNDGDVTCFYCGELQDWYNLDDDEEKIDIHVSDCPVLRYAEYADVLHKTPEDK